MPLSPPAPREAFHERRIACTGYRREDGMWDIEGHLVDSKTYDFESSFRGEVKAGTPVHEMWVRLTIDKGLTVRAVEVVTDAGPFPSCPDITPAFQALEGLTLGPGWTRRVRERVGGIRGCTHIVELMGPLATTAFQTMYSRAGRERTDSKETPKRRPPHIDSCHALRSDGEAVKQAWPDFYTGS